MQYTFQNAKVYAGGKFKDKCFHFSDATADGRRVFSREYVVFPGFCDVHVHFRDPGQEKKDGGKPAVPPKGDEKKGESGTK